MSRTTMLAATTLALGLATSATPAMASTTGHDHGSRTQVAQGHDRGDEWRHHRNHRHHDWGFFVVGGVVEGIDTATGEIRIDPRRGPDRVLKVRDFTRVSLDGDRASFGDLTVGDRAFVRGVTKHDNQYAVRIDALS